MVNRLNLKAREADNAMSASKPGASWPRRSSIAGAPAPRGGHAEGLVRWRGGISNPAECADLQLPEHGGVIRRRAVRPRTRGRPLKRATGAGRRQL